ncbi:MAG TPA: DNA-primase RepB domain-containing protein [Vicinamibacterales bacterium]|nr:DNA-primase RepB domain-containing protein [Vicinamibacterales bacterium]
MPIVDRQAPLRFLETAYQPDDWVAVFLKSYETGRTAQRVGPVSLIADARFQAWLRAENAGHANVYISVNAITPGRRSRTRDAIRAVRHVFLEADTDGPLVLAAIDERADLPRPSYILHSSPNRVHVFWRATHFPIDLAEALQKQLARELHTDPAATPCSQTTRLPGFFNHKYEPAHLVTVDYRSIECRYTPADFPRPVAFATPIRRTRPVLHPLRPDVMARARRYVKAVPPAIAGQHGDLHTFRVCCRLVRGFALTDADALELLAEWNAHCQPPWSERELCDKLRRARRYGREPIAGLLEAQS